MVIGSSYPIPSYTPPLRETSYSATEQEFLERMKAGVKREVSELFERQYTDTVALRNQQIREQAVAKPGSLLLMDVFSRPGAALLSTPGPAAVALEAASAEIPEDPSPFHGHQVAESARDTGFQGNLVELDRMKILSSPASLASAREQEEREKLWLTSTDPEEARQALQDYIGTSRAIYLNDITAELSQLTKNGVRNSALNLSAGNCPAEEAQKVLDRTFADDEEPDKEAQAKSVRNQLLSIFGLSAEAATSDDEQVAGAERSRLFKALLELAEGTGSDPVYQAAKQRYDQAVESFEGLRNSVVVSASNSGDLGEFLDYMSFGQFGNLSGELLRNDLSNRHTTVVGATERKEGQEQVAGYSSDYRGIALYADGDVPAGPEAGQGTSFAAPRVAAVMAQLHGQFPQLDSAQIEKLTVRHMTRKLDDYGDRQPAPVLDTKQTETYFLSCRTGL